MAKEYISREAAISTFERYGLTDDGRAIFESIPAADVVEVVRCRECKHRDKDYFCTARGWPMLMVPNDDFCSKAERKDGGQDDI